jgi:hypothetical protein
MSTTVLLLFIEECVWEGEIPDTLIGDRGIVVGFDVFLFSQLKGIITLSCIGVTA